MINAIKPKAVVAMLAEKDIIISERTLRARARAIGACRMFGNRMFLLPADIDAILADAKPEPKPCVSIDEKEPGTMIFQFKADGFEDPVDRMLKKRHEKQLNKHSSGSVTYLNAVPKRS